MANLRDEILRLINPTPAFRDPEDASDEDTTAKLASNEVGNDNDDIQQPSKLRRKTALTLSDTDKKYAGKRMLRKQMDDFSDDPDSDDGNDEDASEEDEDSTDESEQQDISEFNMKFSQIDTKPSRSKKDKHSKSVSNDGPESTDEGSDMDEDIDDDDDLSGNSDDDSDEMSGDENEINDAEDGLEANNDSDADSDISNDDAEGLDSDMSKGDTDDDGGHSGVSDDEQGQSGDDSGDNGESSDADSDGDEEDNEDGIQKFSSTASDDVAKGQAARQQLGLWDSLLEGRIKIQKAVSLINQLPQNDTWTQYSNSSQTFKHEASKTQLVLQHLLESLVHLQDMLLFQNKETRSMVDKTAASESKKAQAEDSDDEEIPSDSDEDMPQPETSTKPGKKPVKRRLPMHEYPGHLKKRHEDFHSYRNTTIQKWYDKTRLAAGKIKGKSFSAFDQSSLTQINQILADKERLVKRTQMKRSVYRVLGKTQERDEVEVTPQDNEDGPTPTATADDSVKNYDAEIFDDDDFYHQMLRELIEKKTSDISDPVALSRQWLEIQKLRSKNKKKVDTKASKGRKVRYEVHKKLVNFMAALDTCNWSHDARDDLYKSLFGKRFTEENGSV